MERQKFEILVEKSIAELPSDFICQLENITIVIEDKATGEQLRSAKVKKSDTLLGLYQGIPHTERTTGYNMVLPDTITIFQKSIEAQCNHNENRIINEVRRIICHEIAHHFGFDDDQLRKMGI
ncbi:MAG: metallopeptidase family protein [Dehalococcoidia bacterium]|nr:metallopeptidase family protein [Dehalococcoidia bacterium]